MSTPNPFALEDENENERRTLWNPEAAPPKWYDGMGFSEDTAYLGPFYRVLEAAGNGAAKGEAMLSGIWHFQDALGARYLGNVPGAGTYFRERAKAEEEIQQDARDRVRATTPDAATTGIAAQTVHSVVSGLYRATVGSMAGGPLGGAAALGGSEATNRFQELTEQGVDTGAAAGSAAISGIASGAGALMPGGFGSSLVSRVLTGAGANVGMGLAARYADHQLLDAAGYHEMADQQKVWDGTQVVADAILGAAFGGLAHLHATQEAKAETARQALLKAMPAWGQASGATDAARTLEVALRDRAAAPGIAVDPASAAAHQAALEKAQSDLLTGQRVNVADTGLEDARFLSRPSPHAAMGEEIITNALREAGVLDEERNLQDLEAALGRRLRGEPEPMQTPAEAPAAAPRTTFTTAKGSAYEVTENGTTIRNKAARPEHPGEFGPQPESERTFYVTPQDAERLGEFQTQGGAAKSVNLVDQGRAGVRYEEGDSAGKFERRTVVNVQHEPAEGLIPVETWKNGRRVHFGNEITEVRRPESVTSEARPAEEGYTVGEEELTDEQRAAFERLAHPQDQELPAAVGAGRTAGEGRAENDGGRGELGSAGESARVYRGGRGGPLTPEHFDPATLGKATGHPSSGLGVYFTSDASDAARYGNVTEHDLTLHNPKRVPIEDLPGFDTLEEATAFREQLRAKGHDGIVIDATHVGGPKHYVVFEPNGVKPVAPDTATQPLAEHPELQIPDESGNAQPAREALQQADEAVARGEQETPAAVKAAIDCFLRRGG